MASPGRERRGGLFLQILDWMLVPLVVIWPATVVVTYLAASAIADATFDRELRDMTNAVAEEFRSSARDARGARMLPVLNALRNDPVDRLYVQVAYASGEVAAGDALVSRPSLDDPAEPGRVYIREGTVDKQATRIAYAWIPVAEPAGSFWVQVAEPIERRRALVGNVTALVMVMVTLFVPLMVALVWFGLWRGLRPLRELRGRIEARAADDLSPIAPEDAPAEIAPLVESLNGQLDRVRRHIEAQRRFVADAAHQLRTPLAGLKAQADAALRGATLQDARDRLVQIEQSADRLSRLVAQLLSLARADNALAQSPPSEPVDLDDVLREVCGAAAEHALARSVALSFDPATQGARVTGSALLLRELFANLVDNAIRYTSSGGEVAVRVESGPLARVVVEDNGAGIPEGERELVFERFHRVLRGGASGSGLGLAIVRAIADLHQAGVAIEAAGPAGGTRFVVSFPPLGTV
jgi:signal transduction histidine kinase